MHDDIIFLEEKNKNFLNKNMNLEPWTILVVDDEKEVHTFTKLALYDFLFKEKKLLILSEYCAKDAKKMLTNNPNISLVLLDIVMETDNAGLDIIDFIRNELKNQFIRIIIRTGQPGYIIENDIINNYDINDYKEKTELTSEKLYITVRTSLMQYEQLMQLEKTKNDSYNALIYDSTTTLFSRTKLEQDLSRDINFGLIRVDLYEFSTFNNAYGYKIGDQILVEISLNLKKICKDYFAIYRIESDNFIILFKNKSDDYLLEESKNIKKLFSNKSFNIDGLMLYIQTYMGIANYPNTELMNKSQIALNAAKKLNDTHIAMYSKKLNEVKNINNNILWTKRLTQAFEEKNILTYYQSIIDCKSKEIVKYEILVRLKYNNIIYSPKFFLNAARQARLLPQITNVIFEKACKKFTETNIHFSINISDQDLSNRFFASSLYDVSKKYNIHPSRISLEILEDTKLHQSLQAVKNLKKLKKFKFLICIDDFGIENSNFSQLKSLDVDILKIDGTFIKDIEYNHNSYHVVRSITSYAQRINLKTTAEFVHNERIFEIVKTLGITYAQGYYFSKPKEIII